MIFLFEQHSYTEEFLDKVLPHTEGKDKCWDVPKGFVTRSSSGEFVLDGVGYLFNGSSKSKNVSDRIVFVLPKVFLDSSAQNDAAKVSAFGIEVDSNGKDVFGQNFSEEELKETDKPSELLDHKDFLANLSLWVCSSIGKYRETFPDDRDMVSPNPRGFSTDKACPSLIDVKNAMERFYEENKSLFVFVSKNVHSGNNRIDWRRTMRKTPFLQGVGSAATPIYMELVNKKKVFDLDDRLIVLFFSAMNYIEETFGFKMPKSEFYAPMRVNEFRRLLGHRGIMELRRIKHKYFADKFLHLYNIMKAFFEWGGNFSACGFSSEYLLTSKYNNVFEHMIDKLVGDDLPSKMAHLKNQKDGKEIDHLYKDQQLVFADESQKIWFIGDSKYYSDKNDIVGESVYKQFTYARNIIQYNISDLLNYKGDSKDYQGLRYRDSLTEGYSVTPNFFIRGEVPADKIFEMPAAAGAIRKDDADLWNERNRHFENRLFDRDTLLLQVYNVNFLYVLKAFTAKGSGLRTEFKSKARDIFRKNFLKLLDEKYTFWAVYPRTDSLDTFVTNNFRKLQGKMFRRDESDNFIILALEKGTDKNPEILTDVKKVADLMWVAVEKFIDGSDVNCLEVRKVVDGQWSDRDNGFYLKKEIFEERVLNNTTLPKKLVVKSQDGQTVLQEFLLNGGVIPDYSPNGEYGDVDCYFLPCKQCLDK